MNGWTYLVVERVYDIEDLETSGEPHRVCDLIQATAPDGLLANHADVDEEPKDETRSEFIERLEVKGSNRGVQLPANEELQGSTCQEGSTTRR